MNKIESIPHTSTSLPEEYAELLDGPPINNYLKRQVQLAVEKFGVEHPNDTLDKLTLNDVMMSWGDKDSSPCYSRAWSNFVHHPEFKKHERFGGDYSKVTLEDLESFIKTNGEKLPS